MVTIQKIADMLISIVRMERHLLQNAKIIPSLLLLGDIANKQYVNI